MKRILFILPRLSSGGAERQAVTIAIQMKRLGYDVSFICYSDGDFFENSLSEVGIVVNRKVCNYLKRIVFVVNHIRKGRFDVVVSFMPTPNFLNCLAAAFRKRWKVISSERSASEDAILSRKGRLFSTFQRYADFIVCNSENAHQMWLRHYPQYKDKIRTIYNAVCLPQITSQYHPLLYNRVNIVVAATVYRTKNPMGVVNAILLMSSEERSRIHIDWYGKSEAEIGDHSEYDNVIKAIEEGNIHDTITLHDATKNIADIMNASDCVGLFSRIEGLPNAICEAMMIGKPIIMSRCSDYSVLVEEGANGFLCDWDSPESIKDALMRTSYISKDELSEMGKASKRKAEELFSPNRVVEQWLGLM